MGGGNAAKEVLDKEKVHLDKEKVVSHAVKDFFDNAQEVLNNVFAVSDGEKDGVG